MLLFRIRSNNSRVGQWRPAKRCARSARVMRQAHWCPGDSGQRQMLQMSRAPKRAMMIRTVGICRSQAPLLGRTQLDTKSARVHRLPWISFSREWQSRALLCQPRAGGNFGVAIFLRARSEALCASTNEPCIAALAGAHARALTLRACAAASPRLSVRLRFSPPARADVVSSFLHVCRDGCAMCCSLSRQLVCCAPCLRRSFWHTPSRWGVTAVDVHSAMCLWGGQCRWRPLWKKLLVGRTVRT